MSTYCTQSDVNLMYGTSNANKFVTLDNTDTSAEIAARWTELITQASEEMEENGRPLGFQIPFVTEAGATPRTIEHYTAMLAGIMGYMVWANDGFSPEGKPLTTYDNRRQEVRQFWDDVRAGRRILNALKG